MKVTDLIVLVAYIALVVGVGFWFARRSRTSDGFMKAGGRLPGWVIGLSLFGTYLSSNTFIGVPGKAYAGNWNALVFSFSIPLAVIIAARYFVRFYRGTGEISAYEHLERRFGAWARIQTYQLPALGVKKPYSAVPEGSTIVPVGVPDGVSIQALRNAPPPWTERIGDESCPDSASRRM